jgi:hypothetical protein
MAMRIGVPPRASAISGIQLSTSTTTATMRNQKIARGTNSVNKAKTSTAAIAPSIASVSRGMPSIGMRARSGLTACSTARSA